MNTGLRLNVVVVISLLLIFLSILCTTSDNNENDRSDDNTGENTRPDENLTPKLPSSTPPSALMLHRYKAVDNGGLFILKM